MRNDDERGRGSSLTRESAIPGQQHARNPRRQPVEGDPRRQDGPERVTVPTQRPGGVDRRYSMPLLGRTNELARVGGAVRQALSGSHALLAVEGEAGLGKTRLLDELAAGLSGVRVGRAACTPLEQHLPFVPLAASLREAMHGIDLGRQPAALRRILPEIRSSDSGCEFTDVEALEALTGLVAELAPLVLMLDDLHWSDPHTLAALSYLRRRGATTPAAIVTTVATETASADHPVRRLRPDVVVRLHPLTPADLAPLGIPGLHDLTGGNPRLVRESVANGHRGEPSAVVTEMLRAQLTEQGASANRILSAASMLEEPFEPAQLSRLLQTDVHNVVEELERLCDRRILHIDGPRFRFQHQLVRKVLRARLSPARQRLLLGRIDGPDAPGAVQAVNPVPPTERPGEGTRRSGEEASRSREGAPSTSGRSTPPSAAGLVVPLTDRELEVLHLVAAGKRNRDIAGELYVTHDTVKKHVTHILEKLGAVSRTHAAALAREIGLVG